MVDNTVTYVRLPAWLCWTCLADADAVETALLRIGSEERTTVADAIAARARRDARRRLPRPPRAMGRRERTECFKTSTA